MSHPIPAVFWRKLLKFQTHILGHALVLRHGVVVPEDAQEAVLDGFEADLAAVRGNRAGRTPITDADARLLFAATLRRALAVLDPDTTAPR